MSGTMRSKRRHSKRPSAAEQSIGRTPPRLSEVGSGGGHTKAKMELADPREAALAKRRTKTKGKYKGAS